MRYIGIMNMPWSSWKECFSGKTAFSESKVHLIGPNEHQSHMLCIGKQKGVQDMKSSVNIEYIGMLLIFWGNLCKVSQGVTRCRNGWLEKLWHRVNISGYTFCYSHSRKTNDHTKQSRDVPLATEYNYGCTYTTTRGIYSWYMCHGHVFSRKGNV